MTLATDYLSENAQYMADKDQVERLAGLTDTEFDVVLATTDLIGQGSDDPASIMFTGETLSDWDASREGWRERGQRIEAVCGGFPARLFKDFQMYKGQQRVSGLAVVDLGARRVVVG